ncbi:MAG: Tim44 domain-containing protein [Sphingomonadales bacterium]|nr:Tim44 domain-containing protein [Sphingomonadales bacterium]
MTVEIVILAMIAAFLGLRLYSVLGRRAEHDEPLQTRFDAAGTAGQPGGVAPLQMPERPGTITVRAREISPYPPAVEKGLKDIAGADRRFDPAAFLDGARNAYRMILESFWRGDKEQLSQLCDPLVARSFADAIDARVAAGESVDNRLVRIEEAAIVAASYDAPMARVTVRLVSDVAAVTRDAGGHVIAGSLNDAIEVRDIWTFSRNVSSQSPDWHLEEADEG